MGTGRWRHVNCLDIDIETEQIMYVSPDYVVVDVAYLNRHWQGGDFLITRQKNVKIYRKDWNRWSRC